MKKYLLLIALCSLTVLSKAQNCKFAKNEVDEFTGSKIVSTKPLRLPSGMFKVMVLELKRVNDQYFVVMSYAPASSIIPENGELMLKLEDSRIIKLTSTGIETPKTIATGGVVSSHVTGTYKISKAELTQIIGSPVAKARMYFVKDYSEIDISESGRKKITDAINCILSVE